MKRWLGAALWIGAMGVCLGGCGGQVDLRIVLDRADNASLEDLNAIRVNVRELSRTTPEVFEAYEFQPTPEKTLRTSVAVGEPFYVDVWGCAAAEQCVADDVIARGCTQVIVLEEREADEDEIAVGVYIDDMPVDACPPPIPPELRP